MIVKAEFGVRSKEELVVQPFSSKVSRTALIQASESYRKAAESNEPLKPFRVTALRTERGVLYSRGQGFVKLFPDVQYTFSATSIQEDFTEELLSKPAFSFEIYGKKLLCELLKLEVVNHLDVSAQESRLYKVNFLTPTLLQFPRPRLKRKKNRYILFPYPPVMFSSLAQHWNRYFSPPVSRATGTRALYFFREVDYSLSPVTVRYDEGFVRGFVGWVLYSLEARKGSKLRADVRRLLAYANYVGVGKSRSVGFGEVIVKETS
ncbi:CRISPR-associated endoribonuclease Cas6 [Sulfodiicoccus acidiphilus]|uniref:CRISPR-associated endoribonuclease Cas6 n=1 Tax=Sulfodiicoccus acidiphilus TaxID=1670455 RepID=A0A348B585_9CREN|nr:CRISPR-associated endoribonuclease Cas6 [Sulfodiicoccus acidiphilus]BBD73337.1 CRISPR-associated endoribonuclease Cas6 [Sulfodiicoccus acidiphilus]GGT89002.1 CRISPR-associated endoribonuclease Cas6 [Sulfodiicoccus acidiphilus]